MAFGPNQRQVIRKYEPLAMFRKAKQKGQLTIHWTERKFILGCQKHLLSFQKNSDFGFTDEVNGSEPMEIFWISRDWTLKFLQNCLTFLTEN